MHMNRLRRFFIAHKTFVISIGFLVFFSFAVSYADTSLPYHPGQTLDPQCAPGSTNCTVTIASGGTSQWDTVTGGINYAGGDVGIGTTAPQAALDLEGDGTILAVGSNDNTPVPDLGAGSRLEWIPSASAFRAGTVSGTDWDSANVGIGSAAFNQDTTASGVDSVAFGSSTQATGDASSAFGQDTVASNEDATAFGFESTASGDEATAFGQGTIASNTGATAFGFDTTASGLQSTAFGQGTVANAVNGVAIGEYNVGGSNSLFEIGNGTDSSDTSNVFTVTGSDVGIDTATPQAELDLEGDGSIIAVGSDGSGMSVPDLGGSTRMEWIPSASAFRAGSVGGTQWDSSNVGDGSVAFGTNTIASGDDSAALGEDTEANGRYSTAVGFITQASGDYSFAGGDQSTASEDYDFAFGNSAAASGENSIAFGDIVAASGDYSAAFGEDNTARGQNSFVAGNNNLAQGQSSVAFGDDNQATGDDSMAGGFGSTASDDYTFAFGSDAQASAEFATAFGNHTIASNEGATAFGDDNTASNEDATAFGEGNTASGEDSAALGGTSNTAFGEDAVSLGGYNNQANGNNSAAGGDDSIASSDETFAFGFDTTASNEESVAFGESTTASGNQSTAFGLNTQALSNQDTAFGDGTVASGGESTAFGLDTTASGLQSTALGYGTTAAADSSLAIGQFNLGDTGTLFEIGDGTDSSDLSNALTVLDNGDVGIGTDTPADLLSVGSSTQTSGVVAHFETSAAHCDLDPTLTGGLSCSSDMNLKKNITNLADNSAWSFNDNITANNQSILDEVLALNPVQYNWKTETDGTAKHDGFIAQEVQQVFPELVTVGSDGTESLNYTGLIPYTVAAIQQMNMNVSSIDDLTRPNDWRDALENWLADSANGIQSIFSQQVVTPTLCVGTNDDKTCITKSQLDQLLQTGVQSSNPNAPDNTTVVGDPNSGTTSDNTQSPDVTAPTVTPDPSSDDTQDQTQSPDTSGLDVE